MDLVDIKNVINKMCEVVATMINPHKRIKIFTKCESLMLTPRQATSLALIINELIHNALEHAFINKSEGRIDIAAYSDSNDMCLIVSDNGVGLNPDFSFEKSKHLGLTIIKTLVEEDLKGFIKIIGDNGMRIEVRFPLTNKEERMGY
jgi:two-component sensor histidine kinase